MVNSDNKVILFYKKYIEPLTALSVLLMLVVSCSLLYKDHKIKEEIIENCGWGEEDYRCICEKSDVIRMENEIFKNNLTIDMGDYDKVDR